MLGLALFLALGTLAILIFPPMIFSHVEGWSLSEGFYFAFITLSTIGFGDYVVGKKVINPISQGGDHQDSRAGVHRVMGWGYSGSKRLWVFWK